ncbi:hypothetical protein CKAN_02745700 [Cinnamomum micranthum f. kanehirae]|uniref:Uncharacterized protein n=1 Tax=Cinnamomum micranthum f. kanehirae TaxID=337451 RepID=A0A3S3P0B3_9MAGN|nr:hypothetical protein CKAN_02745700 [Cinnamomum micranthum f. kanehirae]
MFKRFVINELGQGESGDHPIFWSDFNYYCGDLIRRKAISLLQRLFSPPPREISLLAPPPPPCGTHDFPLPPRKSLFSLSSLISCSPASKSDFHLSLQNPSPSPFLSLPHSPDLSQAHDDHSSPFFLSLQNPFPSPFLSLPHSPDLSQAHDDHNSPFYLSLQNPSPSPFLSLPPSPDLSEAPDDHSSTAKRAQQPPDARRAFIFLLAPPDASPAPDWFSLDYLEEGFKEISLLIRVVFDHLPATTEARMKEQIRFLEN